MVKVRDKEEQVQYASGFCAMTRSVTTSVFSPFFFWKQ